jgi:hypothetical protein
MLKQVREEGLLPWKRIIPGGHRSRRMPSDFILQKVRCDAEVQSTGRSAAKKASKSSDHLETAWKCAHHARPGRHTSSSRNRGQDAWLSEQCFRQLLAIVRLTKFEATWSWGHFERMVLAQRRYSDPKRGSRRKLGLGDGLAKVPGFGCPT